MLLLIPTDDGVAKWADRWKLVAMIIGFLIGASILVFDAIIDPPADPVSSGFGLILTGLGPAAVKDIVKKFGA